MEQSQHRKALCDLSNSKQKFNKSFSGQLQSKLKSEHRTFKQPHKSVVFQPILEPSVLIGEEQQTYNKATLYLHDPLVVEFLQEFDELFNKEKEKLNEEYNFNSQQQGVFMNQVEEDDQCQLHLDEDKQQHSPLILHTPQHHIHPVTITIPTSTLLHSTHTLQLS